MQCLSNSYKINGTVCQIGPFRGKYLITNLLLCCAFAICSLLPSLAITCSKYWERHTAERHTAAWPLPVAQSQARFLRGTSPTRNSNSDLGYLGLELAYSLDLLENRSLNCPGFKVTVILIQRTIIN